MRESAQRHEQCRWLSTQENNGIPHYLRKQWYLEKVWYLRKVCHTPYCGIGIWYWFPEIPLGFVPLTFGQRAVVLGCC